MKKIVKFSLSLIVVFMFMVIGNKVNAAKYTYNYNWITNIEDFVKIYEVQGSGDITEELEGFFNDSVNYNSNGKVMVYIPSGTYYIHDVNNLAVHKNTFVVAEEDTTLIKVSGTKAILRTKKEENASNITIYGGTYNGNNIAKPMEIASGNNVNIRNIVTTNSPNQGIYVRNSSNLNMENVVSSNNKQNGIYVNRSEITINSINAYGNDEEGIFITGDKEGFSTVTLKNSKIHENREHGIYVKGGSVLYANSTTNYICDNYVTGIAVTGNEGEQKQQTKLYLRDGVINKNGTHPITTVDGIVGHGISANDYSYINVENSTINYNDQCGISLFNGCSARINGNAIFKNGRHGIGARTNISIHEINNNSISSNGTNGILISDKSNGKLTNNFITENNIGVSVSDASNASFEKNNIGNNNASNISVSTDNSKKGYTGAKVTLLDNNHLYGSKNEHGIVASGSTSIEISGKNNKITYNKKNGISVTGNSKLIITGKTTIKQNTKNGIYVEKSTAEIKKASITENKGYGVSFQNKGSYKIWNCTIESNKGYGINISGKGANVKKLKNNQINKNKAGIVANNEAAISTIDSNTISNNSEVGIKVRAKTTVKEIKNNKIEKNKSCGINLLKNSTVKKIQGNTINKNKQIGIVLDQATANEVSNNKITNNGEMGIKLRAKSTIKTLSKNTVKSHSKYGIGVYNSTIKKQQNNNIKKYGKKKIYNG